MVLHLPILSLVTFLPFIGALFIFMIKGDEATVARNSRQLALWASLVTFTLSVLLVLSFDSDVAGFQFVETEQWISGLGIHYRMGVDGISVWFVLLSTFLTPL
ncbi:MAG: NADH-quinone oxidoreductase subunit M, partial [Alphaproteobacteria bacterium]|nr:NADH-quinone oxidoreductase subunit M [Alphaproteobacteria bacterium]